MRKFIMDMWKCIARVRQMGRVQAELGHVRKGEETGERCRSQEAQRVDKWTR